MATPKQVRAIMKRIYFHRHHLQEALNKAHRMKVIPDFNPGEWYEKSPCSALSETRIRIDEVTAPALAKTLAKEIQKDIKGYHW